MFAHRVTVALGFVTKSCGILYACDIREANARVRYSGIRGEMRGQPPQLFSPEVRMRKIVMQPVAVFQGTPSRYVTHQLALMHSIAESHF